MKHFKAGSYWKIKSESKTYKTTGMGGTEFKLFGGEFPDILTKEEDGTYRKHTGICLGGFMIPDEDLVWVENDKRNVILTNLSEMSETFIVEKVAKTQAKP